MKITFTEEEIEAIIEYIIGNQNGKRKQI